MQIDLNAPFTTEDVKNLIASKDDSVHRQLRVSSGGIAYLSDTVGNIDTDGLAFCVETWSAGTGHVGALAANDESGVSRVEAVLRDNWPHPSSTFIDMF
jgi:hypothetical protein